MSSVSYQEEYFEYFDTLAYRAMRGLNRSNHPWNGSRFSKNGILDRGHVVVTRKRLEIDVLNLIFILPEMGDYPLQFIISFL